MKIALTQRDLAIMKWLNSFGFATTIQIANKFKMHPTSAYARLKKLAVNNYFIFGRLFHAKPGMYRATKFATDLTGDLLPPIKKINLAEVHHDLQVIDVSLKLQQQFQAEFITERELRHQKGIAGVGVRGHICDGVLKFGGKNIALEIERTTKSKARLEKIFKEYRRSFDYQEIWYFCENQAIYRSLEKYAAKNKFIKLHLTHDLIGGTNNV